MNEQTLKDAIYEAKRFIVKAEELQRTGNIKTIWTCPKESGACRRASLDLTRKLAELRKPS